MPVVLIAALLFVVTLMSAEDTKPQAAPPVLITAFKPFLNRTLNGSETIAKAIQHAVPGVRIEILVMDVAWDRPGTLLPEAVQRLRPRLLIGLGEGLGGAVHVEQVARNHRAGPDIFGASPPDRLVEKDGPAQRLSTLRFNQAKPLSQEIAVVTNDDAGNYLCNALFYTALGQPVQRVGFVHLPPQGNEDGGEYAKRFVPILRELIQGNLEAGQAEK